SIFRFQRNADDKYRIFAKHQIAARSICFIELRGLSGGLLLKLLYRFCDFRGKFLFEIFRDQGLAALDDGPGCAAGQPEAELTVILRVESKQQPILIDSPLPVELFD